MFRVVSKEVHFIEMPSANHTLFFQMPYALTARVLLVKPQPLMHADEPLPLIAASQPQDPPLSALPSVRAPIHEQTH